jgi:hypothetical protein
MNEDLMSNYCDKCGVHFFAHNDDGSCVDEDPVFEDDLLLEEEDDEVTAPED